MQVLLWKKEEIVTVKGGILRMMDQSKKYLDETLFQARRFGLQSNYIQKLESERKERLEKEKALQTEVYNHSLHN